MQYCPTCRATLKGAPLCRRCKTDLTRVFEAADLARKHYQAAAQAWTEGRFEAMLRHARRSFSLRRTPQCGRLLACAALFQGDYKLALEVWRYMDELSSQTVSGAVRRGGQTFRGR